MKIILKFLWHKQHNHIQEDSLLSVTAAACMLQFLKIKDLCCREIENLLCVNNCLKFWVFTEPLDCTIPCQKAKLLALLEFNFVKQTDYFIQLSLDELINYVGSIYLQCSSEFEVFKSVINWYRHSEERSFETLLKLLHCLDFNSLNIEEIDQIIADTSVSEHEVFTEILNCVAALKNELGENFDTKIVNYARSLLKSKSRNRHGCPCILVDNLEHLPINSTVLYYG